jgi:hypothetical protein
MADRQGSLRRDEMSSPADLGLQRPKTRCRREEKPNEFSDWYPKRTVDDDDD